jgi:hypothetical protein
MDFNKLKKEKKQQSEIRRKQAAEDMVARATTGKTT